MDLRLQNVGLTLPNGRRLFQIPAFEIPGGTHLLLRGASGTGKSSLLHLMAGLMRPSTGSVFLGPHELSALSDGARSTLRRDHMGLIFQKLNLLSHLTVTENVALAGGPDVATALKRVGLAELSEARAAVLSGGEQQRVAVARVLAQKPGIVLADEPTSSLDDKNAAFVIDALKEAARGRTLLVVSHDDRVVRAFSQIVSLEELSK